MSKRVLSIVFSYILALFFAVTMLAGVLCDFAYKTVCDPELLVSHAISSGYATELYDEILYKWENLLSITGIDDTEPFTQVLTLERVEDAAYSYLRNAYTGISEIDTKLMSGELEAKVREYANNNNIHETPQEELDKNVVNLVSACEKEFVNSIKIPVLPKLLSALSKLSPVLKTCPIICMAFSVLLLVFVFFLQKKRTDVLFYCAIGSLTNTVLILGATWATGKYQLVERIPIDLSALRTLAVSYLNCLFDKLQIYGQAFLYASAALVVLYVAVSFIVYFFKKKSACKEEA